MSKVCKDNSIHGYYVEPFAGGASVALYLLMSGIVKHITINDYDKAVFAFWYSAVKQTDRLCEMIDERRIDIDMWRKCKSVMDNKDSEPDLLELGYATLFLNRTNYSGVLKGGVIGGREQLGKYKIDCRFNKKNIIGKIKKIGARKKDITVSNMDAVELIERVRGDSDTLIYLDPPYYNKGKYLYMNYFKHDDHEKLGSKVKSIAHANWIVSYDSAPEIMNIYEGFDNISYDLAHTVNRSKIGEEVMFFSGRLIVDKTRHPVDDYKNSVNEKEDS